jgi:hypothetical protein
MAISHQSRLRAWISGSLREITTWSCKKERLAMHPTGGRSIGSIARHGWPACDEPAVHETVHGLATSGIEHAKASSCSVRRDARSARWPRRPRINCVVWFFPSGPGENPALPTRSRELRREC